MSVYLRRPSHIFFIDTPPTPISTLSLHDALPIYDDTRTLTKLVQRESDRLSRLLSEFLDFARTGVTSVRKADLVEIAHHAADRSEEHTSELQSRGHLVCRLLLEKKKKTKYVTRLQ